MKTKILSVASVAAFGLMGVGCSQTSTVQDNSVAAQFARSMPAGQVVEAGAAISSNPAPGSATPAQILKAIQDAQTARNKPGNPNAGAIPTVPEIIAAIQKAQAQAAAQAQQQKQPGIGPGPFISPTQGAVIGPGPLTTQFVPAVSP